MKNVTSNAVTTRKVKWRDNNGRNRSKHTRRGEEKSGFSIPGAIAAAEMGWKVYGPPGAVVGAILGGALGPSD